MMMLFLNRKAKKKVLGTNLFIPLRPFPYWGECKVIIACREKHQLETFPIPLGVWCAFLAFVLVACFVSHDRFSLGCLREQEERVRSSS